MLNYEELIVANASTDKNAPIVILDSGVGGINIGNKIFELKPVENIVVFSDNGAMPYSDKDPRVLSRRIVSIVANIKKLNPKMIIIGCNTIDAIAGEKIHAQVGNIPLVRIINNTAIEAVKKSKTKKIGLLATTNTIESQEYIINMLGYHPKTHLLGVECPLLGSAIEENNNIKETLKEETEILKLEDIDTLILGCTHYTLIKPMIIKDFPKVEIVDSSEIVINMFLKKFATLNYNSATKGSITIITTKNDDQFKFNINKYVTVGEYKIYEDEVK